MVAYESIIVGTDMASPLELNTGQLALERVAFTPAKKKPRWVEGDEGAVLVDEELAYENSQFELSVRVEPQASMDLALAQVGGLLDMLQEMERRGSDGLPCQWTPSTGTRSYKFYALMGEAQGVPVDWESGWLAKAPLVPVTINARPFLYGAEVTGPSAGASRVVDDFSTNTIGNYTFDTGGGTLAVSGGQLVPSSTAAKELYYSAVPLDVADGQVTFKVTTGASVTGGGLGPFMRRISANNFLWAALEPSGASSTLKIYTNDAGAFTSKATTGAFTLSAATSYWLRIRCEGNVVTAELFTAAPTPSSTPAQTVSATLAGADATKFGTGVAGDMGLRTNNVGTDYRYDDLTIEPGTPVITLLVPSVAGDVRAEGRLVATDTATQTRRFVEWGLEQRYAAEQKAANGGVDPPLLIDSNELVTSGFAGATATRSGAFGNVIRATLTTTPVAVCGTGTLKHIGTVRSRVRIYASSSSVRARLVWQEGDGPFRANPYVTPPASGVLTEVDLGLITVPKALSGTQQWTGRIEAYGAVGDTIDVDFLGLIPAGEGYGKARVVQQFETPTSFSARDEFDQSAGNLNAKTAPVGGTWATSGAATDFAVETAGKTAQRTATLENERYAILGSTNYAACLVQVDMKIATSVAIDPIMYAIARWVDVNNRFVVQLSSRNQVAFQATVAGISVAVGLANVPTVPVGSWYTFRIVIDASGRFFVWFYPQNTVPSAPVLRGQHSSLATGGALASGKPGFADGYNNASACTRNFDNFVVAVPTIDEVIFGGRSLAVRSDSAIRANAAGTIYGPVQTYRGSRFFLPPAGNAARISRIAAIVRRNDVDEMESTGISDSTTVQAFYTPRYLEPR